MYRYFAFISYSHTDIEYARKLQEKLELYGLKSVLDEIKRKKLSADKTMVKMLESKSADKSVYFGDGTRKDAFTGILDLIKDKYKTIMLSKKMKMYPMCRDENEFVPGKTLAKIIFEHMNVSKKLILLCTEDYIEKLTNPTEDGNKSWVLQELDHFVEKNNGSFKDIVFVNVNSDATVVKKMNDFLEKKYKEPEHYMVDGQSKQCYLEIIGALLDVELSVITQREKIRKRKRRRICAAAVVVSAIIFAMLMAGNIINRKINNAIEIKNDDLSKSISLLLESKKLANITPYSDDRIISELKDICEVEYGQPLRFLRFDDEYYSSGDSVVGNNAGNLFSFSLRDKGEYVILDLNTGKEFARYNSNEGELVYHGYDNLNKTIKIESAANGYFSEIDENRIVIETNNVAGDNKIHFVDIKDGSVKTYEIPITWYDIRIGEKGIYYLEGGNLFVHTYSGEDRFIKKNVDLFHIKEDGTVITDVQGEFCGVKDCSKIIASPNNENLYLLTEEGISCVDENTCELKYSVECNGNIMKFSANGVAVIGSGSATAHDCEYLCFNEADGRIIKSIKAWAIPMFDISDDGRYIAYAIDDKVVVEELDKGKKFDVATKRLNIACGFRSDSNVFWTVSTRGEFYTWAVSSDRKVPEIFPEIIFDSNNNEIMWVSDENTTYRYDSNTNELTPLINRCVTFVSQSDKEVEINVQVPESMQPLKFFIDKQTGKIVENIDYDRVEESYLPKDDGTNEIVKNLETALENKKFYVDSIYSQVSKDGKYMAEYIQIDKPNDKYVNRKHMFRVVDIERKKIVYEFEYTDGVKFPIDRTTMRYMPVFDADSEKVAICYEDLNDLKLKTKVCTIRGKEIADYVGYPVYLKGMDKYWDDTLILSDGKKINAVNMFDNKKEIVDKANKILRSIEMAEDETPDIIVASADNDCFRYNSKYNFSGAVDVTIMPVINLMVNDKVHSNDKVIEFELGDIFAVDIVDPNGVCEVYSWIDDNKRYAEKVVNRSTVPIIISESSRDGEEHILNVKAVSNVGNITEEQFKIKCKQ